MFSAGYDIRTKERPTKKLRAEFDEIVGFKYLMGMHINDAKPALGSKVDRHDSIGKGQIGLESF